MAEPDLSRLLAQLNQTQLQEKNQPLFQLISELIKNLKRIQDALNAAIAGNSGDIAEILDVAFLTATDASAILVNSRQLLAGSGITFDDTIANQRTISASVSGGGIWVPLTDGITPETQIVFDGFGQCIMVFVPQP